MHHNKKKYKEFYICLFIFNVIFIVEGCNNNNNEKFTKETLTEKYYIEREIEDIQYEIVKIYPHDTNSFTEGLFVHKGKIYESTGSPENLSFTKSVLGILNIKTGHIDTKVELNKKKYFGEGATALNGKIYQLTYKSQICFVYSLSNYKKENEFHFKNTEGWGITTDGNSLIMSDGTDTITYWNPNNFEITKRIVVTNSGYPENNLNELEFINGYIYANVWTKNYIAKIDSSTGKITGLINFSNLYNEVLKINKNADVLNGIAYDSSTKNIFITGKLWPYVYEVQLK